MSTNSLTSQLKARLSQIQRRANGSNTGVVTMSAEDCDALFDLGLQLIECVEALEQIQQSKGMTNLGSCCVDKTCQPVYDDGEKIAHCAFQFGVLRGFNENACRADDTLTKLRAEVSGKGE